MKRSLLVVSSGFALGGFISLSANADVLVSEEFTVGPGCLANLDADFFFVSDGALTVGSNVIRGGCNAPPGGREYRHALCRTNVPGDFVLDVDVLVENRQEYRAGLVYGWTDPHRYYIFHFNDYENGVLRLIRFDGVTCGHMLASPQFDSLRERWYHVRIEVSGGRHRVFVDGTLRIDVTAPNYVGGQVGLPRRFTGRELQHAPLSDSQIHSLGWVQIARPFPSAATDRRELLPGSHSWEVNDSLRVPRPTSSRETSSQ